MCILYIEESFDTIINMDYGGLWYNAFPWIMGHENRPWTIKCHFFVKCFLLDVSLETRTRIWILLSKSKARKSTIYNLDTQHCNLCYHFFLLFYFFTLNDVNQAHCVNEKKSTVQRKKIKLS